ncbi:hypothetical protein Hanom_Chr02g00162381 [Helianthus anomalus]
MFNFVKITIKAYNYNTTLVTSFHIYEREKPHIKSKVASPNRTQDRIFIHSSTHPLTIFGASSYAPSSSRTRYSLSPTGLNM